MFTSHKITKMLTTFLLFSVISLIYLFSVSPVSAQTTSETTFLYNASGQRIARMEKVGNEFERVYYISPNLEITVRSDRNEWRKNYNFSGKTVAVREKIGTGTESVYYIHQDHLGSTSLVTNSSGNAVAKQRYYPYGQTRATDGTLPTDKEYTGQVSDMDQTGLYYYNARYYDPLLAKFTQADTANDQLNRYAYVGNNPINRIDPSGHCGGPNNACLPWEVNWIDELKNIWSSITTVTSNLVAFAVNDPGGFNHAVGETIVQTLPQIALYSSTLYFGGPVAAEAVDTTLCALSGDPGMCAVMAQAAGPNVGNYSDEVTQLSRYIDEGTELIHAKRYTEAIKHFDNKTTAKSFNLGLDIEVYDIDFSSANALDLIGRKSNYNKGWISLPDTTALPNSLKFEVSLLRAEEWFHALQDKTGRLNLSRIDHEIEVAKYFKNKGINLSGTKWVERYDRYKYLIE